MSELLEQARLMVVDDLHGQEFDVFLSKPVNLSELLAAIRRLQ
jgi:DNA-binding response OmpR family regulator